MERNCQVNQLERPFKIGWNMQKIAVVYVLLRFIAMLVLFIQWIHAKINMQI